MQKDNSFLFDRQAYPPHAAMVQSVSGAPFSRLARKLVRKSDRQPFRPYVRPSVDQSVSHFSDSVSDFRPYKLLESYPIL